MALTDGNPGAMRAEAAFWRAQARIVEEFAGRAQSKVAGLTFEGPAAERLRSSVQSNSGQASGVAADLSALAGALEADADTVEAAQLAQARAQAAAAEEEAARLAADQGGAGD